MPTPVTPSTNAVPMAFQTASILHPASLFRLMLQSIIGTQGVGNINGGNDFKVAAGTGLHVVVSSGGAYVQGDDISDQGFYFLYLDTDTTLTIDAADVFARTDIVIAQVKDKTANVANNDTWVLTTVKGDSSGSAPVAPVSSIVLAEVAIPASATAVAAITDRRGGSAAAMNSSTLVDWQLIAQEINYNVASTSPIAIYNYTIYKPTDWATWDLVLLTAVRADYVGDTDWRRLTCGLYVGGTSAGVGTDFVWSAGLGGINSVQTSPVFGSRGGLATNAAVTLKAWEPTTPTANLKVLSQNGVALKFRRS